MREVLKPASIADGGRTFIYLYTSFAHKMMENGFFGSILSCV
jgi:hypothetical protein